MAAFVLAGIAVPPENTIRLNWDTSSSNELPQAAGNLRSVTAHCANLGSHRRGFPRSAQKGTTRRRASRDVARDHAARRYQCCKLPTCGKATMRPRQAGSTSRSIHAAATADVWTCAAGLMAPLGAGVRPPRDRLRVLEQGRIAAWFFGRRQCPAGPARHARRSREAARGV